MCLSVFLSSRANSCIKLENIFFTSCVTILFSSVHFFRLTTLLNDIIVVLCFFALIMFRRSVRIQDNERRDLAEKIRQANQLKEREDSEVPLVRVYCKLPDW